MSLTLNPSSRRCPAMTSLSSNPAWSEPITIRLAVVFPAASPLPAAGPTPPPPPCRGAGRGPTPSLLRCGGRERFLHHHLLRYERFGLDRWWLDLNRYRLDPDEVDEAD